MHVWQTIQQFRCERRRSNIRADVSCRGSARAAGGFANMRTAKTISGIVGALILIGSTFSLQAQVTAPLLVNVRQVTPSRDYIAPVWSPASENQLAFTSNGFAGIHLMDLSARSIETLTVENASGFQFLWAPDGEHIVYRAKHDQRSSVIRIVNVRTRSKRSMSKAGAELGLPTFTSEQEIAYLVGDRLEEIAVGEKSIDVPGQSKRPVAYQQDDQIFMAINGTVHRVSKSPGKYYLPRLSPDGTKVVYEEISRGIYLSNVGDLDEEICLGNGNSPSWSPDSLYIAYDNPIDDGREIFSSSLYVFDVIGRKATRMPNSVSAVERRPSFSADGARVAFDANGAIYVADFVRGLEVTPVGANK